MTAELKRRVLLVCPPWQSAVLPSLAIGTLRPILDAAGIETDELHSSTLFPLTPSINHSGFLARISGYLFTTLLNPEIDPERMIRRMIEMCRSDRNPGEMLHDKEATDQEEYQPLVRYDVKRALDAARVCIERCVAKASKSAYDVIGMSVTFETQIPAALVLAKRFKALWPGVKIILGGAACAGDQGDGIIASFPLIDAVCRTEGESVIVPLIHALRGALPLSAVPGVAYRNLDGVPQRTASPPLLTDLDKLPMPRFEDFIEQFEASEWAPMAQPHLTFETSRGCWYGEKNLCSFCGLNGEGLAYRRKSPERAFQEIRTLYTKYPSSGYLEATDNILDMGYLKDVMPRLATLPMDKGRPLELFFEIKSNLRRDQVHTLVHGHVVAVQPGIESFSDGVLELMNKGCTGANQVQFLKWIDEAGIKPTYNLLMRNPGEKAAWYREMEELLPFIRHLPPPTGLSQMNLERFSPYHKNPGNYGITNMRPRSNYQDLFANQAIDERVAYTFDYDHEIMHDQELLAAHRSFGAKVVKWQDTWRPGRLVFIERGDYIELHDRRVAKKPVVMLLRGVAAEVFRYLNSARKRASLEQQFAHVDGALIDCLVAVWHKRRWMCEISGRLLVVVPEYFPDGMPKPRVPVPKSTGTSKRTEPEVNAELR